MEDRKPKSDRNVRCGERRHSGGSAEFAISRLDPGSAGNARNYLAGPRSSCGRRPAERLFQLGWIESKVNALPGVPSCLPRGTMLF
jgi:hypothetical protein